MFDLSMPFQSKKQRAYAIIRFPDDWEACIIREEWLLRVVDENNKDRGLSAW